MKHKEQRVLVLFDVQNMYYSAKQLFHTKVNFASILSKAVSGRRLIRAIAYVIKTDIKEEVNFHEALNNIGIEVKAKDLQIFLGGAKKGDWDIGIAMDAVRLNSKVDTVVLVSGDGDFKELLQYLQSHGCRAEVIAFGRTTSKHLREVADDYVDMEREPQRYLINYRVPAKTIGRQSGSGKPEFKKDAAKDANLSVVAGSANGNNDIKPANGNFVANPQATGNVKAASSVNVPFSQRPKPQYTSTGPSASTLPRINTSSNKWFGPKDSGQKAPADKGFAKKEFLSKDKDVDLNESIANLGSDFGLDDELSNTSLDPGSPQPEPSQPQPTTAQAQAKPSEKPKDQHKPKKEGFVKKIASKLKKK